MTCEIGFKIQVDQVMIVCLPAFLCFLQTFVEIEDFRRARPDAIAHSAVKILSRLKTSGEKTIQALKSLCWRCKGIQVEVTPAESLHEQFQSYD